MDSIIINLEQVRKSAREWYDKGQLTAQHPDPRSRMCINEVKDAEGKCYRCAVATVFPEDWAPMKLFGPIEHGVEMGHVIVGDPVELAQIVRVQFSHDIWADAMRQFSTDSGTAPLIEKMKNSFLYNIRYSSFHEIKSV